jgi:hypothetical protein
MAWPVARAPQAEHGLAHVALLQGAMLTFNNEVAVVYLLPTNHLPTDLRIAKISGERNEAVKTLSQERLGMPEGF